MVQSWRGVDSLAAGARQGYTGILSAPYYLDGMKTNEAHYLADPIPADTTLTPEQQKLILGGEVCMWAEQLNERTIDSRIWPRTAVMAERFWSPQIRPRCCVDVPAAAEDVDRTGAGGAEAHDRTGDDAPQHQRTGESDCADDAGGRAGAGELWRALGRPAHGRTHAAGPAGGYRGARSAVAL